MGHACCVCALCRVDARFGCRRIGLLALPDAGHFVGQLVFLVLEGLWQRQRLQPAASITAYKFNSSIAQIFVNKPVNHLSTPHDSCTNNRTPRQFSFFPRQIVEISGIRLPSKTLVTAPWTPWAQALQGMVCCRRRLSSPWVFMLPNAFCFSFPIHIFI